MAKCEVCGNDYDKSFKIEAQGKMHVFDSFECAIHALTPSCGHCGCRVIGHGVEGNGKIYCCAHCAKQAGVVGVDDQTVRKVTATGGGDDAGRSGRQPRERRGHVIV